MLIERWGPRSKFGSALQSRSFCGLSRGDRRKWLTKYSDLTYKHRFLLNREEEEYESCLWWPQPNKRLIDDQMDLDGEEGGMLIKIIFGSGSSPWLRLFSRKNKTWTAVAHQVLQIKVLLWVSRVTFTFRHSLPAIKRVIKNSIGSHSWALYLIIIIVIEGDDLLNTSIVKCSFCDSLFNTCGGRWINRLMMLMMVMTGS